MVLQTLQIENFAIIESVSLDFKQGMTVLTGETGAGKSIIIDALSLIAGARGSQEFIRHGSDKCRIQASFYSENFSQFNELFDSFMIDVFDNELIIIRELHRSGKNIIRINGTLVTVATLKDIMKHFIDIHGQHEHQYLMNSTYHLSLLDQFGQNSLKHVKQSYEDCYKEYMAIKNQLKQVMTDEKNTTERARYLKEQITYIDSIDPLVDEDVKIEKELKHMHMSREKLEVFSKMDQSLGNEDYSARVCLEDALRSYYSLIHHEDSGYEFENRLEEVLHAVIDLSRDVSREIDDLEFDEDYFNELHDRINLLNDLTGRYDKSIAEILEDYQKWSEELAFIEHKDTLIQELSNQFMTCRETLLQEAKRLSDKRREVALSLEEHVQQQLKDLYMDKVVFHVQFQEENSPKIRANGSDSIEFLVATNVGEPLKPLAKVASGGEISRLMLALKTIFSTTQNLSTIVFDEIDTGVSGRVAQAIANKMRHIADSVQVLCITHLPQVAAIANEHLFVKKMVKEDRTITSVDVLPYEERRLEVARMFTGDHLTESALKHAEDLLRG